MKKLLIAVLLVCMGLLIADPIPIGGGALTNTSLPMEPYYGYTYSQVIYTADEIGGAVDIENVAWHYNGNSAWTEACTIYMGHTTLDEFDEYPSWITLDNLTEVWTGDFTVTAVDGWVTVTLDTPFAYDGSSNLVIALDANTAGYNSSSDEFYGSTTTLDRSIVFYSDGTNPDPANPPTGTYRSDDLNITNLDAQNEEKSMPRAAYVRAMIANIILNYDGTFPSGFVNGYVYDDTSMDPIEGATVSLGNSIVTTDAMGFYEIEVFAQGPQIVSVNAEGYYPGSDVVTVLMNQTASLDFYLEVFDPAGTSCEDPWVIDTLPYTQTGMSTNLYGNEYTTTMACASYYMGGNDFVYAYTPDMDMSINIALTNSTYGGLFVVEGFVDDPEAACIDLATGTNVSLQEIPLQMGVTYYIVIATSSYYMDLDFDIEITETLFGNLDGTVTELDGGAPIEGATVTVGLLTATTDASGYYMFENLIAGLYDVLVTAEGYFSGSEVGVEVQDGITTTVNFELEMFDNIGDTIEDPIVIDAFPYFMSGDISLYTDYSTGAGLTGTHSGEDVYWMFEVTEPSMMDLNSCGSEFDTYMNLYDSNYAQIAYDDDGCDPDPGSGLASWIGTGDGFLVQPGTYYVCNEAYSTNHTNPYFEVHFDILPPPPMGAIAGIVTDAATTLPIEGAEVTVDGTVQYTDVDGNYEFAGLLTGLYDVTVTAAGYNGASVMGAEVLADETTQVDIALEPIAGVVFEMTVDNYPSEASWNVWDVANGVFVWETAFTFTTAGEVQTVSADLPDGAYEVYCYDTFGDGGITGVVSKEDVILTQWAGTVYNGSTGAEGIFPFVVIPIVFGTLEGTVTDSYTGDGINGASIVCGTYEVLTNTEGYYSIPSILANTYTVTCSVPYYNSQDAMDVVVTEDMTTTQDFALEIIMNSPTNLQATVDGYDVNLTWEAPIIPEAGQIIYDDGIAENATAWYDPGNERSVLFTNTNGACTVAGGSMNIYDGTWPLGVILTPFTAKLWEYDPVTGLPGEELASVETTPTDYGWVSFTFDAPVEIPNGIFFLGYAQGGTYPDCAPIAVDETLPTINRSYEHYVTGELPWVVSSYQDFMIRATLQDETGRNEVLTKDNHKINIDPMKKYPGHRELLSIDNQNIKSNPMKENPGQVSLFTGLVPQLSEKTVMENNVNGSSRAFTGSYNIYRNDELIATVDDTMYDDMGLDAGEYEYYVTAVYDEGESPESNHETASCGNPEMAVDPLEFDVVVGADGTADYDLTIGNDGDLTLEYDAEIIYYEGRAVAEVYPQDVNYWTGTTNGTTFTETSLVNATPTVGEGWMMFDVSGIPDGAIINSIECNVYVNDCNWPYWSLTPCTLDPLTTDAATLAEHIVAGNPSGVAYSYNDESGTFAPGAYVYPLGGTANADLEAALANDWFAVGASPRDASTTYYTILDGWNEANPPYLVIDYSIPINPWVTFDGNMMMDGMVEVGAGANAHNLHFDAAGLVDGDVMMGEIVLNSNDLYNEEVIIPITMTIGAAYMYGDVTGDEIIDAFDAANVLQYTVGMDPVGAPLPWTWELMAGDVDGNGAPEAYDAALILQYSVGMIDMFPVEGRSEIAKAEVTLGAENGELVFNTTGNLYGFSVSTDSELITFGEVETAYLSAANGNAFALASAEVIEGDFLRIPFELLEDSGEITFTMTANGISSENTYNVEDLQGGIITANVVLGNYPNPFNPTTDIMLQAKEATNVKVDIYNVRGQLVKSLVNENVEMGAYSYTWSGTDNSNHPVSSGVYFYKVQIGSDNSTHKMIMLK